MNKRVLNKFNGYFRWAIMLLLVTHHALAFLQPVIYTCQYAEPPLLTTSANVICPGSAVTLTAANCAGVTHWPDQSTGFVWVGRPVQTTGFAYQIYKLPEQPGWYGQSGHRGGGFQK